VNCDKLGFGVDHGVNGTEGLITYVNLLEME